MKRKELEKILSNNGATLTKQGKQATFKNGYQVSKKDGYILKVSDIDPILQAVNDLLKEVSESDFVGLWVNNGLVYIDISERIPTKKEAIKQGKNNGQKSIYNWHTEKCIYL